MNIKATVTIKTPLGDTDPLFPSNFVKQGTVLGPVLNNCSLNKLSTDSIGYNLGSVQIKSMEFVDDLADPNRDKQSALTSNAVLQAIQHEKRLTFSAEKCELLKINSKDDTCLKVNGRSMKQVNVACYLGDHFNCQGNNSDLCKERVTKAIKGTIIELCFLCKGINMGNKQIESMLLLYKTVFMPRLIYNCEAWSNLTPKDYLTLQASQLTYLRNVLEVSKATPIAAMYLELGILPVKYEIEMRNEFLKRLLDKKHDDPCLLTYIEMLKFENETNWANVFGLRRVYNLPLNDDNIKKMSVSHWKYFVKSAIFKEALLQLQVELSSNRKTSHITYQHSSLKPNDYLLQLPSHLARLVFKAKTRMLDIKINYTRKKYKCLHCPFCSACDETFEHIFKCNAGLRVPKQLKDSRHSHFQWRRQRSFSKSWDIFLTNTINIVRKLSEGEHYNFWLNECCYESAIVLLLFLLFFYSYQCFNNLI